MRLIKKLPNFNAVAAGQTAIADIPTGWSYHQLELRYNRGGAAATSAQFASDITRIKLSVDGDVKWDLTGTELIAINSYYGVFDGGFTDGVLPLFFSRPWHRTAQSEDLTKWGTADVETFAMEIDIAAAVPNPDPKLFGVVGPNTPLGDHVCMRKFAKSASGAGVLEISDLPKGNYAVLAEHISTASLSDIEVEADTRLVFGPQVDKPTLESYYEQTQRVWQTGFWHVDFAVTDRLTDAFPLNVQDFRHRLNMTGAVASFNIIQERLERRGGIPLSA